MPDHVTNNITLSGDRWQVKSLMKKIKSNGSGIGSIDFEKILPLPDNYYSNSDRSTGKVICGRKNRNDWCEANWGTKWNTCGYPSDAKHKFGELRFYTASKAPHPVIQKLSEMFPRVKIQHEWADENIGANCGRYVYYGGKRIEEFFPKNRKESLEFAAKVMRVDLAEDYGLYLNATESNYITIENDGYELIEIAGQIALFTDELALDVFIPKGMYCYQVRENNKHRICAIEKNIPENNHAGSIITKEPIDLGEKGYLELDIDSSPTFFDEYMSIASFNEYDPEESEELSMGMEQV